MKMILNLDIKSTSIIKKVRLFVFVYSIIVSSVGAIYYSNILIFEFDTITYSELIVYYILVCMLLLLLVTNVGLIIKRDFLTFSLKYSMFIYALQTFDFKLFDLNYEFLIGIKTAIYFVLYDGFFIEFSMSIFKLSFVIIYPAYSNGIFIGFNIIPLIIFGLYFFIYKNRNVY